jgi:hypothetical protein
MCRKSLPSNQSTVERLPIAKYFVPEGDDLSGGVGDWSCHTTEDFGRGAIPASYLGSETLDLDETPGSCTVPRIGMDNTRSDRAIDVTVCCLTTPGI